MEFNEWIPGHRHREWSIMLVHDLSKSLSLEKELSLCISLALSIIVVLQILELCTKELHWDVHGLIV